MTDAPWGRLRKKSTANGACRLALEAARRDAETAAGACPVPSSWLASADDLPSLRNIRRGGGGRFVSEIIVGAVLGRTPPDQRRKGHRPAQGGGSADVACAILAADPATLSEAIRPSGYYNVKTQRLLNLCVFLERQGGLDAPWQQSMEPSDPVARVKREWVRDADDILLYAFDRPVFVIDTYTRRLLTAIRTGAGAETYDELRGKVSSASYRPTSRLFSNITH